MNWRTFPLLAFIALLSAVLMGRLVFLQILNQDFYKALAQGQQNISLVDQGERGDIFAKDKDGNLYLLATNRKIPYAFVTPVEIKEKEEGARRLAELLDLEEERVLEALGKEWSLHEVLKKDLAPAEERAVLEEAMQGLYVGYETRRFYPHGSFAAHVLGFVNREGKGQYGVEEYYDPQLRGKEGLKTIMNNPAGYLLSLFHDTIQDGSDLILSIDFNIQAEAERVIQASTAQVGAERGLILVVDPKSGQILALASTPSFDPNNFSAVKDIRVFQNMATQYLYEPGSVFKPLTMAAALEEGAVSPETTYEDEGVLQIGGYEIENYDSRVWGERTMTEVLEFSINTGAVFAERQLGHRKFQEYFGRLLFTEPSGIDLAGEAYSRNRELQKGYEINFATASFGQGIEVTPVQLLQAYTALLGSGAPKQLKVAEAFMYPKEGKKELEPDKSYAAIFSPETVNKIAGMLVSVVEERFARQAGVPGYSIAGKTGTAQVSWSALDISKSGYSDKTIQSFVGFAPAYDPQVLVLVRIDYPATRTAEYSAIPTFRSLMPYILNYYEIPPDNPE